LNILRVAIEDQNVLQKFLDAKKKIKAIKHLRDLTGAPLRHAKDAIDQMTGVILKNPLAVVQSPWIVENVRVVSPTGMRLELSMKDLELKFLQESTKIGLGEVADLLDLTNFIKSWQLPTSKKKGVMK